MFFPLLSDELRMKSALIFAFFISFVSWPSLADESAAPGAPKEQIHVLQMDSKFPIEQMKGKGVVLHPLSAVGRADETIAAADRDEILIKADLLKSVQGWDALDKDLLMLRTEKQELPKVIKKYEGQIPEKKITGLKKLILQFRKTQGGK
jgi:hypothetical protein